MQLFKIFTILLLTFSIQGFIFAQHKVTVEIGYRSLKDFVPESSSNEIADCGYCDKSNTRENSPTPGQGGYVQATLHAKRFFFPLQIGVLKWNDNFEGSSKTTYYHPHAPNWWGPITHYREYTISYRSISHYLNFSPGVGFNLLNPSWKFHLGPIVRINPQFLLSRKETANSVTEHYKHTENPPGNPPVDEEWYVQGQNARDYISLREPIKGGNLFYDINASAGMSSSGVLFHSFGYSVEAGYQLQNFSRIALGQIEQRSSFYLQFGILYQVK